MKEKSCESCFMPFSKAPGVRESEQYCSYCFNNGKLCYEGDDVKEFQKAAYRGMRSHGMNVLQAKFFTWLIKFAPRWRK